MLDGYKTYIAGAAVIIHQVLAMVGIDFDQAAISHAFDTIAGILVLVFRKMAKAG